jgi:hypothetical protein
VTEDVVSEISYKTALDSDVELDEEFASAEVVVTQHTTRLTSLECAPMSDVLPNNDMNISVYQQALTLARQGQIAYRKLRLEETGCHSEEDFLAKLHVLRIASDNMFSREGTFEWFESAGTQLMTAILNKSGDDAGGFLHAFSDMMTFLRSITQTPAGVTELAELMRRRRVVRLSFYDAFLDFVFLDAFDDLKVFARSLRVILLCIRCAGLVARVCTCMSPSIGTTTGHPLRTRVEMAPICCQI